MSVELKTKSLQKNNGTIHMCVVFNDEKNVKIFNYKEKC
jgi:hypothetical protein